jgi:hypothetical protein
VAQAAGQALSRLLRRCGQGPESLSGEAALSGSVPEPQMLEQTAPGN